MPIVKHFSMLLHNLALEPQSPPKGRGAQGKPSSNFPVSENSDFKLNHTYSPGFPGSSAGKKSACNAGDPSLISGSGRSPREGIGCPLQCSWASLVAQMVKNPPTMRENKPGFDPWAGKIPWKREQLPTPVFWPGESHGQRSLAGYSPWGCRVGHD